MKAFFFFVVGRGLKEYEKCVGNSKVYYKFRIFFLIQRFVKKFVGIIEILLKIMEKISCNF